MCKDINEALIEDVIEITWMFNGLMSAGKIPGWEELSDKFNGSDGIKNEIVHIAREFEKRYPFDTAWETGDIDYIEEIEKFSEEQLLKIFKSDKE